MAVPVYKGTNITSATTTVVKTGRGILHGITINKWLTAGVITVYDNTAASGTKIATITLSTAQVTDVPQALYDVRFTTGLTVVTSSAVDITVMYA